MSILEEVKELREEVKELKRVIDQLGSNTYLLSGGIRIFDNEDLNDYMTLGNYYCSRSAQAQTIKNCPVSNAFTLKIEFAAGIAYPCQIVRDFHNSDTYFRYFRDDSVWSEWKKITV